MRIVALLGIIMLFSAHAGAQTTDTTVYSVAEKMPYPLLNSCNPELHPGWTSDSVRKCAETQLMSILARNIQYPQEAREGNIEGTVVASFIIEPDGRMSHLSILKDIGGGCGPEALRVLKGLDEIGLRWSPGANGDKPVRIRQALPLKFKLQEALPWYLSPEGDSIYIDYETAPAFAGGNDSLYQYILNKLEYPAAFTDSCKCGIIEMALIVQPNGAVRVGNQLDYSNLGLDFQWNALRLVNRSAGKWTPAVYKGKAVATTFPLRVLFKSPGKRCTQKNADFDQAMLLADEGATLQDQGKVEEAIQKWSAALKLTPENTEIIYYRGSAYLNQNKRTEACADYNDIKARLGVTWFENIRKLVCGW